MSGGCRSMISKESSIVTSLSTSSIDVEVVTSIDVEVVMSIDVEVVMSVNIEVVPSVDVEVLPPVDVEVVSSVPASSTQLSSLDTCCSSLFAIMSSSSCIGIIYSSSNDAKNLSHLSFFFFSRVALAS
ncbi:hypothetical protein F2Q68_00033768 [Brassica cretica]|uniref:Uncharacterized protein n=1 Tax=Brassica cretica TaxID=69181 RepID=A0A8S9H767_BRACR|nr:hypothetical protein F2Q68_00033768 [Brassica cretica]